MTDNFFSDDNAMKSAWITWGKPGDFIKGTLVSKALRENKISDKKGDMQWVYELKTMSGEFHALEADENGNKVPVADATVINDGELWMVGGKPAVDAQMRNVKIGQILGMKFIESVPAKDKSRYPTKVIKVYTEGKMDEEFLTGLKEEADEATRAENVKNF